MRAVRLKRTKDYGIRIENEKGKILCREGKRQYIGNWLVKSCHVVVEVDLYIHDTKYI